MMKLLYLLLILFTPTLFAASFSYHSFEMMPAALPQTELMDTVFDQEGFHALAETTHGIPSLGINQVYYKTETQFVMVKYDIQGEVPLDELLVTPKGFMIHRKQNDKVHMLYFRGMNVEYVKLLLNRMSNQVSNFKFLKNILIQTAHAEECGALGRPILNQSAEISGISAGAAWQSLKSCMTGVGSGVMDSTVGVAKGVASEVWSFVSHPVDYVEKVADKVELFLVKTAKFIKQLVTDPDEAFASMGRGLGKTWETVKKGVANMSTDMKINFVCSFIASLGVDAAIAFFTGGAASGKIILTINNLARKFGMIGKMLKLLGKLNATVLSKFKLQGAKLEKFMKGLFNNKIPEGDLMHLDELAQASDELSLRTLSCYIR